MKPIMFKGKKITINHFVPVISIEQMEGQMGVGNTKNFMRWMAGQTMSPYGVYADDLERWLKGKPVID